MEIDKNLENFGPLLLTSFPAIKKMCLILLQCIATSYRPMVLACMPFSMAPQKSQILINLDKVFEII